MKNQAGLIDPFVNPNGAINGSSLTTSGTVTANDVIYANGTTGTYTFSGAYTYLAPSGTGSASFTGSSSVFSLIAARRIKAVEYDSVSSKNIKNVISRNQKTIEQEVLDILDKIKIVQYEYKDSLKDGTGRYYGVIAEELAEVLPNYVNNSENYVGNIMSLTSVTKIKNGHYKFLLEKPLSETIINTNLQIKVPERETQQERDVSVKIIENNTDSLMIECEEDLPESVFVYGTFESCPAVAKDRLSELALIGVKSLLVDRQSNKKTIKELILTIDELKSEILELRSHF